MSWNYVTISKPWPSGIRHFRFLDFSKESSNSKIISKFNPYFSIKTGKFQTACQSMVVIPTLRPCSMGSTVFGWFDWLGFFVFYWENTIFGWFG